MALRVRLLSSIAATLVAALAAPLAPVLAADIPPQVPSRPAWQAPVQAPYSWYGFYIGVQGGYGWGSRPIAYEPNALYAAALGGGALPTGVADDPRGFIGGITYGTNWQFGNVVIGTESDWSFANIKKRDTLGPLAGFAVSVTGEQELKSLSTTRGRIGFLLGERVLIFGTGGFASGTVEGSSTFNLVAPAACAGAGNCPTGSGDKWRWGWAAGGGIEFANGPWSVKVDYLHYDLGTLRYNVADPTLPGGLIVASQKVSGDIVRAGINYRFNWTALDLILGRR